MPKPLPSPVLPGFNCMVDYSASLQQVLVMAACDPSRLYLISSSCGRKSHLVDELSSSYAAPLEPRIALAGETFIHSWASNDDFMKSRLLGVFFCHRKPKTRELGSVHSIFLENPPFVGILTKMYDPLTSFDRYSKCSPKQMPVQERASNLTEHAGYSKPTLRG